MDISKFLGKVIGIYLIIISISMLINMNYIINLIYHFITNPALMFFTGCLTLILGILLIVSHNIWQWNWRVIITLIAWVVFFKGASIVICPKIIDKTTMLFLQSIQTPYITASFDLLLGILLIYLGFRREYPT